jgi:diguanylate cyclase (GGDEF)-like protein
VSFRGRLTVFFLLIVVLPMVVIAALVVSITNDARSGKADARLAEGLVIARSLYSDELKASRKAARGIAGDRTLDAALRSGSRRAAASAARAAVRRHGARSVVVRDAGGRMVATVGPHPIATWHSVLRTATGTEIASVTASATTAGSYLAEVHRRTDLDAAISDAGAPIAATVGLASPRLPAPGHAAEVEGGGAGMRAATAALPGGGGLELTVLGPLETGGYFASRPLVGAGLALFFALGLAAVAAIVRGLAGQVRAMLGAAKRIGEGDFSGEVPVVGNDEMAGLANEFNKMSGRLAEQVTELRSQRDEIERSVQRIGQAFASGLDRRALLEIVVDTALTACSAEYGIIALTGHLGEEVERGEPTSQLRDAVLAAEERASREGTLVEQSGDGAAVLSSPLSVAGESARRGSVMTVARAGAPFDANERDVFVYLLGQISSSIENIALHELVSEQAVTDDLTGLSNKRRFRELLEKEAARAERFGHELSLLMLDIDNFKQINDTHGHLQGDEVLRRIAAALDSESRGVDEPARYGGEEFAVALPETGLQGALEVAERIRARIASQQIARFDGEGSIAITASIGAATMSGGPEDTEALIAAADAALYEAKAAGKDQVIAAG